MPVKNVKLTKKADLLKGAKLAKKPVNRKKIKPEEIDFSNPQQLAELLEITPELLDPTVKNPRFVKNDMLSAARISRALKLDSSMVTKEMQKLYKDGTTIHADNNQEYNIIIVDRRVHHGSINLRVHPLAIRPFLSRILLLRNINNKQNDNITNQGR